jgi:NADH-quinone oxidoreductase subunit M
LATLLFGPKDEKFAVVPDEQGVSLVPLLLLGLFIVGFGLFPSLLMNVVNCGIEPLAPLFEKIAAAPTLMGGVR